MVGDALSAAVLAIGGLLAGGLGAVQSILGAVHDARDICTTLRVPILPATECGNCPEPQGCQHWLTPTLLGILCAGTIGYILGARQLVPVKKPAVPYFYADLTGSAASPPTPSSKPSLPVGGKKKKFSAPASAEAVWQPR